MKEKESLNRAFGFSDPPKHIHALGKDQTAAVWWDYTPPVSPEPVEGEEKEAEPVEPDPNLATGWEVHRFRKDKSKPNGDWLYKGFTSYGDLEKTQVVVDSLTNDFEYRFTVKTINSKGVGSESLPSNPVMVEAPLPAETDPYFPDESILLNFSEFELDALQALFDEDMAHFKCVSVTQFMDILREIGEKCRKGWIVQLYRGYVRNEEELTTWTQFMTIMNHIKKHRIDQGEVLSRPLLNFFLWFTRRKMKTLMQPKACKMGDWRMEYSSLAGRNFYKNTVTGESYWSMPAQVKFYIPPKLEAKLLKVFDYGQIEEFQQYFSLLDVDNSGDLSGKEIRLLLNAMDIRIGERKFQKLLKTIDLNGNGTIEFDEYCWMMAEIHRKDRSAFFRDMNGKSPLRPKQSAHVMNNNNLDDSTSFYNAANNSYNEGDLSIFEDRAFKDRLNFNTLKYTILSFRNNYNNSSSMRYRVPDVFKSMRRLGSSRSLERGNSMSSIDYLDRGRRGSLSSLSTATGGFVRRITSVFAPRRQSTVSVADPYNTNTNNDNNNNRSTMNDAQMAHMLSQFDDTKSIHSSDVPAKKMRTSFLSRQRANSGHSEASSGYHGSFGHQSSVSTLGNPDHLDDEDDDNDQQVIVPTQRMVGNKRAPPGPPPPDDANTKPALSIVTKHAAKAKNVVIAVKSAITVETSSPPKVVTGAGSRAGGGSLIHQAILSANAAYQNQEGDVPLDAPVLAPASPILKRIGSPKQHRVSFSNRRDEPETTSGTMSNTNSPAVSVAVRKVFSNAPENDSSVNGSPLQATRRTSILKTESSIGTPSSGVRKSLAFAPPPGSESVEGSPVVRRTSILKLDGSPSPGLRKNSISFASSPKSSSSPTHSQQQTVSAYVPSSSPANTPVTSTSTAGVLSRETSNKSLGALSKTGSNSSMSRKSSMKSPQASPALRRVSSKKKIVPVDDSDDEDTPPPVVVKRRGSSFSAMVRNVSSKFLGGDDDEDSRSSKGSAKELHLNLSCPFGEGAAVAGTIDEESSKSCYRAAKALEALGDYRVAHTYLLRMDKLAIKRCVKMQERLAELSGSSTVMELPMTTLMTKVLSHIASDIIVESTEKLGSSSGNGGAKKSPVSVEKLAALKAIADDQFKDTKYAEARQKYLQCLAMFTASSAECSPSNILANMAHILLSQNDLPYAALCSLIAVIFDATHHRSLLVLIEAMFKMDLHKEVQILCDKASEKVSSTVWEKITDLIHKYEVIEGL
eukprot:gene26082-32613_t